MLTLTAFVLYAFLKLVIGVFFVCATIYTWVENFKYYKENKRFDKTTLYAAIAMTILVIIVPKFLF
jgi:hypothetical protein